MENILINSPKVQNLKDRIESIYRYETTSVKKVGGKLIVTPLSSNLQIVTDKKVPKIGVMLVGWGGNNGSTLTAAILANKHGFTWGTKDGILKPNFFGSITQSSTIHLGDLLIDSNSDSSNGDCNEMETNACNNNPHYEPIYVPIKHLLPMVEPCDITLDGWDISSLNLAQSMQRARVIDYNLQTQLVPLMKEMKPRASVYIPDFIAANQAGRADNTFPAVWTKSQIVERIRSDIRDFKSQSGIDQCIVLWTANTERFCNVEPGLNLTARELLASIEANASEISPSTLFGVASVLEHCTYINGSPQNTFVPGLIELAEQNDVFIAGDDFKTGQTKVKSVLVDFLVSAGIKPLSIVSYNHLGNNDGYNLSAPSQFKSKEITKSNVVDDMVASNTILYGPSGKKGKNKREIDESGKNCAKHQNYSETNGNFSNFNSDNSVEGISKPDHCIVIKYVPQVGDSKRALDEYMSELMLGGRHTLVIHNTCEDSLLAAPLILDLIILAELFSRVKYRPLDTTDSKLEGMYPVLSILSYLLKAPLVRSGTPVINAFFKQKACIENILRACVGLPPQNNMMLEYKLKQGMDMFQQNFASNSTLLTNGDLLSGKMMNGHSESFKSDLKLNKNGFIMKEKLQNGFLSQP